MLQVIKRLIIYGAFGLAGLSIGSCGSSATVVAWVENTPITKASLDHWLWIQGYARPQAILGEESSREKPEQDALDFLICAQWTLAEAARLGLRVSDAEAAKQLDRFKYARLEGAPPVDVPNESGLQAALADGQETRLDQIWLMKLDLLAAKVRGARLETAEHSITRAQVERYYRQHLRLFIVPEEREFDIILTYHLAQTERAKREIESGRSFLSVAKRMPVDPEAPHGVQHLKRGEEEPEFVAHVFAARPHVLTGPIHQAYDYYIFEITKVTPAHLQGRVRAESTIRQRLGRAILRQGPAGPREELEARWAALTRCASGYQAPGCRLTWPARRGT